VFGETIWRGATPEMKVWHRIDVRIVGLLARAR
jgi:hypothetical protein